MKKILLLFALFASHFLMAQNFTVNGINYTVLPSTTNVQVATHPTTFSGAAVIPATVSFNNVQYTVVSIVNSAFSQCVNLTSVSIPNTVTTIGGSAFLNCNKLSTLVIPDSVITLGSKAMIGCRGLTSITLSNALTTISSQILFNNSNLTHLTLGSVVSDISSAAFGECISLIYFTVKSDTPPSVVSSVFQNINRSNCTLFVPAGKVAAYRAAAGWNVFGTIVEAGANVTISNNTNLITSGNVTINFKGGIVTNNGTITNSNGSLAFSAPVVFEGTGTTNTRNLKINHTGTSLISNRINVSSALEVSNGSLNANNNLTLLSNATNSAIIAPVAAGGTIRGKVTAQRYIPQGKRAFRFLTPSVTTDDFISNNWQLATHITGSTTGANGFDTTGSGNPSLFTYNNQQATGTGWTAIANTNATNLQATVGYRLQVRGDRNVNINAASEANMNNAITLNATGTVATGTIVINTSSNPAMNNTTNATTNGYSLIGNPYVNTVNWNTLTKTGLTDAYYAWDANMGTAAQRGRYVAFSTATGSNNVASAVNQFIQPGQAFFVKNTTVGTAGTLTFNETDKAGTNVNSTFFRTSATALSRLDLQVFETNEMALSPNPVDAAVAVFGSQFSNQIEAGDVEKLSSGTENLSFLNNGTPLAIDARAVVATTDELQIQLQQFQANKSYTFRPQFSNFEASTTPFLLDTYLNQYTPLALNTPTNVTFTTTADVASFATNRFKIVFQNVTLTNPTFAAEHVNLYPNPVANNQFSIALPSYYAGKVNVTIINAIGQQVYQVKQEAQNNLSITPNATLAQGMYLVQIENQGNTITKKITIQ